MPKPTARAAQPCRVSSDDNVHELVLVFAVRLSCRTRLENTLHEGQ